MTILERYVARTVTRATLTTLIALVALLVLFNFIDEFEDVGRGYETLDAFIVGGLSAPRYLYELFPVAVLIGALLALGGLASHSEITAMRSVGFSSNHLLKALLKMGAVLMVIVALMGEYFGPIAENFAQDYRHAKLHGTVVMRSRHGFWAREGDSFVNIRRVANGSTIQQVKIYDFKKDNTLSLATSANSGEHINEEWKLKDIQQTEFTALSLTNRQLESATWKSQFDPSVLAVAVVRPTMLSTTELIEYIDFLDHNGQNANEYEVALWTKLATPIASIVMLVLAVPFALGNQRDASRGKRIFTGMILGASFYLLSRAMSYVAVAYSVSPGLMVIIPSLVFLGSALWLLKRVR